MKKTYLPKPHGFTIVELLVVIVIVGLLSVLGIMSGRKNLKTAALSEGEAFIEEIVTKERIYRANNGRFIDTNNLYDKDGRVPEFVQGGSDPKRLYESPNLQINGHKNKYFSKFSVFDCDNNGNGFKVAVFGSRKNSSNTSKNGINLSTMEDISITAKYNAQTNDFDLIDGEKFKVNGL